MLTLRSPPSSSLLYELGNDYIRANASWATMAQVSSVRVAPTTSAAGGDGSDGDEGDAEHVVRNARVPVSASGSPSRAK